VYAIYTKAILQQKTCMLKKARRFLEKAENMVLINYNENIINLYFKVFIQFRTELLHL
jgi:hypothetical protein